jgi:transposase
VGAALAGAQKKADDEGQVIVWVDQSGFYLLPHHVRTWARQGQTPVLRVPLTRDHRSVIAAITADQRLVMQTQTTAYHSADVVRFLRLLLRKIAGKRLHLERLPGYAPDLNPVEGIWNYLKCRELGNVCCTDFAEFDTALRRAKERLRHKRQVIRGCIAECGYHL